MYYKTIIKGRFDFGKPNTYRKVRKMADSKFEGLYRNEIAFVNDEVFDDEEMSFVIPRTVYNLTEKIWKNSVNLVEYLAQFAVVGRFEVWVIKEGALILEKVIEPNSEKIIVQRYIQANKQMEAGDTDAAMCSFDKLIDKYEKHALAYEKRGLINYQLDNYEDALYDFTKSINLFPQNGTAYFGKSLALIKLKKDPEAIQALQDTIHKTIPHQGVYWKARRMRGEVAFNLGQFEMAHQEFDLITKRKFDQSDSNFLWLRYCYYMLGNALYQLERYGEACNALDKALKIEPKEDQYGNEDEIFLLKGKILKEIGDRNYLKNWKAAEKMGNKMAKSLLEAE